MSVNKIINASGSNDMRSVSRSGALYNKRTIKTDLNTDIVTEEDSRLNPSYSSYVWSSGTSIGTAGQIIYTSASGGGSLAETVIANRGTTTVFYGLNNESPSVSNGAALLEGESVKFNEPINTIWAITSAGNANIEVHGLLNNNTNSI